MVQTNQVKINPTPSNHSDTILESLLDGVLIVDTFGYIVYANKSAEELFRKPSKDLVGQNFGFSVTPYEIQEIEVIQGKMTLSVQMLATIIKWGRKNVFLMTLRDVSEKKKLEDNLRNANDELRNAQQQLKQLNAELEETEMKVSFRNAELEKEIRALKKEIEKLRK